MSSNNITMLEVKIVEYLKKLLSEQKDYSYIVYEISNCLEEVNEKNRLKLTINIINNKEFDNILKSYVKNGKLDTAFSGTVKVNGVTYTIKNGQLVK